MWNKLSVMTMGELFQDYPYAQDFFLSIPGHIEISTQVGDYFEMIEEEVFEDSGIERSVFQKHFIAFMERMKQLQKQQEKVKSITILGGLDKGGAEENVALTIQAGEIICIVGATGSGKSRLLADIEWMAQRDTPTGRQILVNGKIPDEKRRFSIESKLVAQLSQNMNFVMDMTVKEFIGMHAESKMLENASEIADNVICKANELAGEGFSPETPITALSGGQSRALMIADAAYLSICPIVLIDEIENAGIDRQRALRLLVDKQKIILMTTHDPILALMGDKRLVIKNGGISGVITTSKQERCNLLALEKIDRQLSSIRELLRSGGRFDVSFAELFQEK